MNFQRRRFTICIYAVFLVLAVTINICMFGAKADDSVLCSLQYENLECYSDKNGKIVTLQRGNGQTIIGSSKVGDPITYDCEYDFSKKCENSIYLFKNYEDTSEDDSLKKLDVAVYSIAKHEIYCEKTLDVSVSDPKKCAVLKGGKVCVVSSKFPKNMFVCNCSTGKMKVHCFKSNIESINASLDGTLLYAKLLDKNEVVVYGNTSLKEVDDIELVDDIEPQFLNENIFMDTDGGTYIKSSDEFIPFANFDVYNGHMCFDDPYLIYASESDKINFVDVTSREEYASMKVNGEIVYLAPCGTSFVYVVKRDGTLFCNKLKSENAISGISLAEAEKNKDELIDEQESTGAENVKETNADKGQTLQSTGTDVQDDVDAHVDKVSQDDSVTDSTIKLDTDDEGKKSFEELQAQIDKKEIEQSIVDLVAQQTEVLDAQNSKGNLEKQESLDEIKNPEMETVFEDIQGQVDHKEMQSKLADIVKETQCDDVQYDQNVFKPMTETADKKWLSLKRINGLFDSTEDFLQMKKGMNKKISGVGVETDPIKYGFSKVINPKHVTSSPGDKKSKGMKRNMRAPKGLKRKRARRASPIEDMSVRSNSVKSANESGKEVEMLFPENVWIGRNNKVYSSDFRSKSRDQLTNNLKNKGKRCKSINERSIFSKNISPKLKKQKSMYQNKKHMYLKDIRECIAKSTLYRLNLSKNFIRNIDIKTSFSQFKKNLDLTADVNIIFKKNGKSMKTGNIGTNTTMEIETDDTGVATLTAIVPGDITGSSKVNKASIKMMCRHIFREKLLEGAYFEAGDINGDGIVDTLDLLLLSKMVEERS